MAALLAPAFATIRTLVHTMTLYGCVKYIWVCWADIHTYTTDIT